MSHQTGRFEKSSTQKCLAREKIEKRICQFFERKYDSFGGAAFKGGGEGSPNLPDMVFYDSVRYPEVPYEIM